MLLDVKSSLENIFKEKGSDLINSGLTNFSLGLQFAKENQITWSEHIYALIT
jgi:hypothetical protein